MLIVGPFILGKIILSWYKTGTSRINGKFFVVSCVSNFHVLCFDRKNNNGYFKKI